MCSVNDALQAPMAQIQRAFQAMTRVIVTRKLITFGGNVLSVGASATRHSCDEQRSCQENSTMR